MRSLLKYLFPLLLAASALADQPAADRQRILGTWTVVGIQDECLEEGTGRGGYQVIVTPEAIRMVSRDLAKPYRLTATKYTLEPAKKFIDFEQTGQGKTQTYKGLYDVTDDTLKIIWCGHLTKFTSRPDSLLTKEQSANEILVIARREENFTNLVDLAHWGNPGDGWKVENLKGEGAVLKSSRPDQGLVSKKADFKDFVLRLEYGDPAASAGTVALRGPGNDAWKIGLGATNAGGAKVRSRPFLTWQGKKYEGAYLSHHTTHHAEFRVQGNRLTAWLGGHVVIDNVEVPGCGVSGPIELTATDAGTKFRSVRIKAQ